MFRLLIVERSRQPIAKPLANGLVAKWHLSSFVTYCLGGFIPRTYQAKKKKKKAKPLNKKEMLSST